VSDTVELGPYLNFNGQCAAAFSFYAQILGGKTTMQTFGESPMKDQVPADWRDKVLHARLVIEDKVIMGSDAPPPHYSAPKGMHVSLSVPSPGEAERIFTALAEQGKVTMPFQKTFWSPGFGMAVDRFGIPWIVNSDQAS
jgi:PhnB protein